MENDQEKIEEELFGNKCPFSPCCSIGCYQALDDESASHPCRFDRLVQNEDAIKAITRAKSQSQADLKFSEDLCKSKDICIEKHQAEIEKLYEDVSWWKKVYDETHAAWRKCQAEIEALKKEVS
jgi:chromosome segregation ATPase